MNFFQKIISNRNRHKYLQQHLAINSAYRFQIMLLVLGVMQFVQLTLYLANPDALVSEVGIIWLKVIVVILCITFSFLIRLIKKGNKVLIKYSEVLIIFIVAVMILWSVNNAFQAQVITSDISIYILVIFTIAATVRIRPWLLVCVMLLGYILFAIGMPYYQPNPEYLKSHIINGLILNIVAMIINIMFYRFAISDYFISKDNALKATRIRRLLEIDNLTGLLNHRTIYKELGKIIDSSHREQNSFYLFVFDMDNYREINKIHGHDIGDELMIYIGKVIKKNLKDQDYAARYGDDEFMMIISSNKFEEVRGMIIRMRADILAYNHHDINVTFSGGIVKWTHEAEDELIAEAYRLVEESKENGRNQVAG